MANTRRNDSKTRPLRAKLKGYSSGASARGNLQVFKRQVTVEIAGANGRGRLTMQGKLSDDPILEEGSDLTVDARTVIVSRVNGRTAPEDTTFRFEGEATRLHVAGSIPGADEFFDLWEAWPEESEWFLDYDKLISDSLDSPYDVRAVVEISEEENVLFVETIGNGGSPVLIALNTKRERSAVPVRHVEAVGLTCSRSSCETGMLAFRIAPDVCVFVVRSEQEVCGMRCHTESAAVLVTLTAEGFVTGPSLDGGQFWPALDEDSTSYVRNGLYWIDADGVAPLELLEVNTSTQGREITRSVEILGYDPKRKGFTKREDFSAAALQAVADEFAEGSAFVEY